MKVRLLLMAWSLPYGLIGLVAALLFWAVGWVHAGGWRDGALELVCHGPFARWMNRERQVVLPDGEIEVRRWNGFTLGWTILFWAVPDEQLRQHEHRHVDHGRWFSITYPLVWGVLTLLFGYDDNPLERDARRAAGEE